MNPALTLHDYLAAQQTNADEFRRLPHYPRLIMAVDALYRQATDLMPSNSSPVTGRFLLLAHRSFLSSAALCLRALPDDAEAITRRALEAARLAILIKHDPTNRERWQVWERRLARWRQRQEGERPPELRLGLTYPEGNDTVDRLGRAIGMVSDAAVHLTPEFLIRQGWDHVEDGDLVQVRLSYFCRDPDHVAAGLWRLAADHLLCLRAFDECLDGTFSGNYRWRSLRAQTEEAGRALDPTQGGR